MVKKIKKLFMIMTILFFSVGVLKKQEAVVMPSLLPAMPTPVIIEKQKEVITADIIKEMLANSADLITAKYFYTNAIAYKDTKMVNGYTLPFTTKAFVVKYDGQIQAGIDLSDVSFEIFEDEVVFHLQDVRIINHFIDETSIEIVDENNSLMNPIRLLDLKTAITAEKYVMESKAIRLGLLEQALLNCKNVMLNITSAYNMSTRFVFDKSEVTNKRIKY